jgi:hypothetical protein
MDEKRHLDGTGSGDPVRPGAGPAGLMDHGDGGMSRKSFFAGVAT